MGARGSYIYRERGCAREERAPIDWHGTDEVEPEPKLEIVVRDGERVGDELPVMDVGSTEVDDDIL